MREVKLKKMLKNRQMLNYQENVMVFIFHRKHWLHWDLELTTAIHVIEFS